MCWDRQPLLIPAVAGVLSQHAGLHSFACGFSIVKETQSCRKQQCHCGCQSTRRQCIRCIDRASAPAEALATFGLQAFPHVGVGALYVPRADSCVEAVSRTLKSGAIDKHCLYCARDIRSHDGRIARVSTDEFELAVHVSRQ